MKKLIIALITLTTTASFASTPQELQKCAQAYALTALEEYNLPNEAVIATSPEAKQAALKVLDLADHSALDPYEAVGLVIQYGDEVQLYYVGVNLRQGQCQIRQIGDLNTVDISAEASGLKPEEASVFFLNYSKLELEQLLGAETTIGDIYDGVIENLTNY